MNNTISCVLCHDLEPDSLMRDKHPLGGRWQLPAEEQG